MVTNEPNALQLKGFDTVTFLLTDNGYPLVSETFMVMATTIKGTTSDKIKAFLRAEIMGWRDSLA